MLKIAPVLFLFFACTSTQEIVSYQQKLRERSMSAYQTRESALRSAAKNCVEVFPGKNSVVKILENSPVLVQDKEENILAHFSVLCFRKAVGESLILKIESENRGGNMSNIHFLIPATTLFDSKGKVVPTKSAAGRVIQPLWTAWRFATDQQIPREAAGKIYVLLEADNRSGVGTISSANSKTTTYAAGVFIPVSVSKDVKSYPTGTLHVTLEKNL